MKTLIKKKIYMGRVELRDYEVDMLLAANETVKVVIDNPKIKEHKQCMILTPDRLKEGQFINTQFSKYNSGQTYLLRGYKWKPEPVTKTRLEPVLDETGRIIKYIIYN